MDSNEYRKLVGARMQEIRKISGISQVELAKILHTTPLTIIRYEQGKRMPDAEFIHNFANHFKISPAWIVIESSPTASPPDSKEITEIVQAVKRDKALLDVVLTVVRLKNQKQ